MKLTDNFAVVGISDKMVERNYMILYNLFGRTVYDCLIPSVYSHC